MSYAAQAVERSRREAAGLDLDPVGQGLMVQPRRADGSGQRHPMIDDVADDVIYHSDDARTAGRAQYEKEPSRRVEHHRRGHG